MANHQEGTMMTRIDEGMLSLQEACAYVGVSEVTIMRYIREDKLTSYKVANRARFYREDLDSAFKRQHSDRKED